MLVTGFVILVVSAVVIGIAVFWNIFTPPPGRRMEQRFGPNPAIPAPRPQGKVPTLKMPSARGWRDGEAPQVAQGLQVAPFAKDLKHPRWIYVLPNGDVLVAESATLPSKVTSFTRWMANKTMRRAGAQVESANRITLLRDADGDGVPELREVFLEGLSQPFGMALVGDTFYVGNTGNLMAFPHQAGQTRITAPGKKLFDIKPGGHWTRSLLVSPDQSRIYVGVGSQSNIGDNGLEAEQGRALILEYTIATDTVRTFASGLRNAVGMAWEPQTGALWTVVNERDGLGDETPPDYLTSVNDGGFYGWPYSYWGRTVDERVQPERPDLVATAITPDYALGGHTASLGLCWVPEGTLPGLPAGMAIGQHGSWNRTTLSGYKVILVPFENGKPNGRPHELLWGFLTQDESQSYGRPVGVTLAADGSLLVADDVGNTVWRLTAAR